MSTSATSTVPAALDALVARLNDYFAEPLNDLEDRSAHEAWPGPAEATPDMVVLGEIRWAGYVIATIKAGRQHRQEDWTVAFDVFALGGDDTSPENPAAARNRAFATLAALENVLADDPHAGLTPQVVQRVEIRPSEAGPRVFEKGWAYRIAGDLAVFARLT